MMDETLEKLIIFLAGVLVGTLLMCVLMKLAG